MVEVGRQSLVVDWMKKVKVIDAHGSLIFSSIRPLPRSLSLFLSLFLYSSKALLRGQGLAKVLQGLWGFREKLFSRGLYRGGL